MNLRRIVLRLLCCVMLVWALLLAVLLSSLDPAPAAALLAGEELVSRLVRS